MTKHSNKLRMWMWLLALPLLQLGSGVVFAQGQTAAPAKVDYSKMTLVETCFQCHKDNGEANARTAHADTSQFGRAADLTKSSHEANCEGCHGPAKQHADAEIKAEQNDTKDPEAKKLIFDFLAKTTTPREINQRCLTCHASGPNQINSPNSFHRQNDVSCTDCHSMHHATTDQSLLVKQQPTLCFTCHLQQKSQFNMPFRHRVLEGLIQCSDCHNQHGTGGVWESDHYVRQVRTSDSGDFVCYKCHMEKQGPFVFQHNSVKIEGCTACHIPHGGANPHMLKWSNVNLLCLQCHTSIPHRDMAIMDAQNSTYQQACIICHTEIHGSNFSNLFFR